MPDATARIVTLLLAALLVWAAAAKLLRWNAWRAALAGYGLPPRLEGAAAAGTPLVELGVAAVLMSPAARAGAALTVALLAAFSLVVLRGRSLQGEKLPCGCFGRSGERDYRTMLLRNAVLGLLAAVVLLSGREESALAGLSLPDGRELFPALLVTLGVAVAAWTGYQVMTTARRGTRS
jgi:hypothetical protein